MEGERRGRGMDGGRIEGEGTRGSHRERTEWDDTSAGGWRNESACEGEAFFSI